MTIRKKDPIADDVAILEFTKGNIPFIQDFANASYSQYLFTVGQGTRYVDNIEALDFIMDSPLIKRYAVGIDKIDLLNSACRNGNLNLVEHLFKRKDIDFSQEENDAFRTCCRCNNVEMMKYLLSVIPNLDINQRYGVTGNTHLMDACRFDSGEAVEFLFNHPDFDFQKSFYNLNHNDKDALMIVCENSNIELLDSFIFDKNIQLNRVQEQFLLDNPEDASYAQKAIRMRELDASLTKENKTSAKIKI